MKKFLIILGSARSGSTALMNIVGSLPNSEIKGESWGSLILIIRSYQRLLQNIATKQGKPNTGFQHLEVEEMRAKTRHFILQDWMKVEPADFDYLGFKEVRFADFGSAEELRKWMGAASDLFAGEVHFILNLRDEGEILASMNRRPSWWLEKPSLDLIQKERTLLEEAFALAREEGYSTSVVNHGEWSQEPEALWSLFEDLGEPVPEEFLERYYQKLSH